MTTDTHVYVVDDDAGVRKATSLLLRSLGYDPRPFISGIDFLDSLSELKPGCVLLDVRMAQMSGLEVLGRLTAMHQRFPTIVITGHGDVETAVRAMKLGAVDFLEKPFSEAILLAAIGNAFARLSGVDDAKVPDHSAAVGSLTQRQIAVLSGLAEGLSNKAIAHELNIAPRTVEMHRANMMARLGVRSLAETLRVALALDLPPLSKSHAA